MVIFRSRFRTGQAPPSPLQGHKHGIAEEREQWNGFIAVFVTKQLLEQSYWIVTAGLNVFVPHKDFAYMSYATPVVK